MKELKVFVSPHYSEDEIYDEVSGITFRKSTSIEVYSVRLEEKELSGIQTLLRKNFLFAFDKETMDFVNGKNIAKEEVKAPVVVEEVAEVIEEEVKEEKKPRKRTKKEAK